MMIVKMPGLAACALMTSLMIVGSAQGAIKQIDLCAFSGFETVESFEGIVAGPNVGVTGLGFLFPGSVSPYDFGSGVTMTAPIPNSGAILAWDQATSIPVGLGTNGTIDDVGDVPDGTAYLFAEGSIEFTFDQPQLRVGALVTGPDFDITIEAFSASGLSLGSASVSTVHVDNWGANLLGVQDTSNLGIKRIVLTWPGIGVVIDALRFEPVGAGSPPIELSFLVEVESSPTLDCQFPDLDSVNTLMAGDLLLISFTIDPFHPNIDPIPTSENYKLLSPMRIHFVSNVSHAPVNLVFPSSLGNCNGRGSLIVQNDDPTWGDRLNFTADEDLRLRIDMRLDASTTDALLTSEVQPACLDPADWDFNLVNNKATLTTGSCVIGGFEGCEYNVTLRPVLIVSGRCSGLVAIARARPGVLTVGDFEAPYILDGSLSTESLGTTTIYDWVPLTIGTPDPAPTLDEVITVMLPAGTHQYRLVVSDSCGTTSAPATYNEVEIVIEGSLAPADCDGDANGSGEVNFADITSVLANWLSICP